MNRIVAAQPGRTIHVVLDNLNTHKKNEDWLALHPNVRFHFTPTRASWLNQVEIWFSILTGKALTGASFTSVAQLRAHIDAFIAAYVLTIIIVPLELRYLESWAFPVLNILTCVLLVILMTYAVMPFLSRFIFRHWLYR